MTADLLHHPAAPLEWGALWDAMAAHPGRWIPTTRRMYWELLEAVPPRAVSRCGAFLCGEAHHSDPEGWPTYAAFRVQSGRYAARYLTLRQFYQEFKS